jgi:hypothetical protein
LIAASHCLDRSLICSVACMGANSPPLRRARDRLGQVDRWRRNALARCTWVDAQYLERVLIGTVSSTSSTPNKVKGNDRKQTASTKNIGYGRLLMSSIALPKFQRSGHVTAGARFSVHARILSCSAALPR